MICTMVQIHVINIEKVMLFYRKKTYIEQCRFKITMSKFPNSAFIVSQFVRSVFFQPEFF